MSQIHARVWFKSRSVLNDRRSHRTNSGTLDGEPSTAAGEAGGTHVAHTESLGRVPGGAKTGM